MSDDKADLQDVVANYLIDHPDFLDDRPDILAALEINHHSGAAVSLIERQVDQLRASNEDLERRLNRLIQVASDNERLMSRLHRLTLELLTTGSRLDFFTRLGDSLLNDFNADILRICLFDRDVAAEASDEVVGISSDDPGLEPFQELLAQGRSVCGRLGQNRLEYLFGDDGANVQSAALVALGDQGAIGMMAIGSSDPARFYPGMGTLFLDLLADVIATSLADRVSTAQRRSA
jgi:uncharacterized protein YigA (DUF484 family)